MLQEEIEYFNQHRAEWLTQFAGKVALVKSRTLVGVYDDEIQALSEGTRLYSLTPYLVRRITQEQPELNAPALALGLPVTNADTTLFDYWPAGNAGQP